MARVENAYKQFNILIFIEKYLNYSFSHQKHQKILIFGYFLLKLLVFTWLTYISAGVWANVADISILYTTFVVITTQTIVIFDFLIICNRRYLCLQQSVDSLQTINNLLGKHSKSHSAKSFKASGKTRLSKMAYILNSRICVCERVQTPTSTFIFIFSKHSVHVLINILTNAQMYTQNYTLLLYLTFSYISVAYCEAYIAAILGYVLYKYREINCILREFSILRKNKVMMDVGAEDKMFVDISLSYGLLHDIMEVLSATTGLFTIGKWFIAFLSLIRYPYEMISEGKYLIPSLPWMILNFWGLLGHLIVQETINIEVSLCKISALISVYRYYFFI